MNIQSDKPYTLYLKEYQGKKYYKVKISKKKKDGTYENGYIDIQFRQGVEFADKESIYIKTAFLSFYKTKEKATIPYIMVMDYKKAESTNNNDEKANIEEKDTTDLFAEFGEEHKDDEMEYPF